METTDGVREFPSATSERFSTAVGAAVAKEQRTVATNDEKSMAFGSFMYQGHGILMDIVAYVRSCLLVVGHLRSLT